MLNRNVVVGPTPFYVLFAVSGFSGLIYESIWTHYIKLFLGHAAYAQTLVLAIFMGGMAIGAWFAGRRAHRWRNPLVTYAVVEGLIGIAALVFHRLFVAATDASYDHVIPAIGSPLGAQLWKWALSGALILPQSILLGMTFPLMSGGIVRQWPDTPGKSLAVLYFANSIGGAIGVLASGFWLIVMFGLPGTIYTAGLINILLALFVVLCARGQPAAPALASPAASEPGNRAWIRWMLAVSAITGAASFCYEIAWIRLLSLVLGSSTHAFELMLSAFILGLALGGLWIKRRIESLANPVRTLANIQIAMALLALATLPLYAKSFDFMSEALTALARNETAYYGFNAISHLICLAVMVPATFCAGMTLPLITFLLIKRGYGERAIGAVYSANTVGGIAAVLIAVNALMPLVGAKGLLGVGGALDLALGLALLWKALVHQRIRFAAVTAVAASAFVAIFVTSQIDPLKIAASVFRGVGKPFGAGAQAILYRDGRTATVTLVKDKAGSLTLSTNGKPDARIMGDTDKPSGDEPTMILMGAFALAANPHAKSAAVIGMGSGLSANTLLSTPQLERVDTIEIEPQMVAGARMIGEPVRHVFDDPRSHIHFEDAKVFFSTHHRRYDIIASEPSNPWVSGVSSLFTQEFYHRVKQHLADDGVFAQWVQLYEVDVDVVASIMSSVSAEFSDYAIVALTDFDVLILARKSGEMSALDPAFLSQPGLAKALGRIGMRTPQDIEARWLGTKRVLDPMFQSVGSPANSDFFPYVDHNAVRTRFLRSGAGDLTGLAVSWLPMLEMLGASPAPGAPLTPTVLLQQARVDESTRQLRSAILERRYGDTAQSANPAMLMPILFVEACDDARQESMWVEGLVALAATIVPSSTPAELETIWSRITDAKCFGKRSAKQREWLDLVRAVGRRDAPAMLKLSEKILAEARRGGRPEPMQYALRAAMLGNLLGPERGNLAQLWFAYGSLGFSSPQPPLDVRLMMSLDEPDAYKTWHAMAGARHKVVARQ